MDAITSLVPRARRVTLGGEEYRIGEARLSDLADLQAWLDARWPDPLANLRRRPEGMGLEDYEEALKDAFDAAEAGPPCWGSPRGMAEFAGAEGMIHFAKVALRQHHPELDGEDVVRIVLGMEGADFGALQRAFWRPSVEDEVYRLLGFPDPASGPAIGWAQAVMETCELYGWPPREVYALTLSEFAAARTGGKPKVSGIPLEDGLTAAAAIERQKRNFYGPGWKAKVGE